MSGSDKRQKMLSLKQFLFYSDFDNIKNKIETEIELREYQKELSVDGCEGENVVVLAPTNSGKTWVACKIIQVS